MTEGQTGTSTRERTSIGRLTADPSRARCRSGGTSAKAARIAAIPEGPAPDDAAAASAETHRGGSPAGGSGGSRSASPVPAWLRGRVSRRACVEWCRAENPWMRRPGAGSRRTGGRAERAPAVGRGAPGLRPGSGRVPTAARRSSFPPLRRPQLQPAPWRTEGRLPRAARRPSRSKARRRPATSLGGAPRVSRTDSRSVRGGSPRARWTGPRPAASRPQLRTAAGPAIPTATRRTTRRPAEPRSTSAQMSWTSRASEADELLNGVLHHRRPVQGLGLAERSGQRGSAGLLCRCAVGGGVLCRVRGLEDRLGARTGRPGWPIGPRTGRSARGRRRWRRPRPFRRRGANASYRVWTTVASASRACSTRTSWPAHCDKTPPPRTPSWKSCWSTAAVPAADATLPAAWAPGPVEDGIAL